LRTRSRWCRPRLPPWSRCRAPGTGGGASRRDRERGPRRAGDATFTATLLSADAERTRLRVRTPEGERLVQLNTGWVIRNGKIADQRALRPGMRLQVSAREKSGDWIATSVEVL
jgi:hypothetical protein